MFARRLRHTGRIEIDAPPEQVWSVIRPAESAPLLDPRCVEAWTRMPARPGGHEVQVQVLLVEDVRYRSEFAVLEEDPPRYARTEWVSLTREDPHTRLACPRAGSEFVLTALPGGRTLYEHRSWEEGRRWRRTADERRTIDELSREELRRTRIQCEAAG